MRGREKKRETQLCLVLFLFCVFFLCMCEGRGFSATQEFKRKTLKNRSAFKEKEGKKERQQREVAALCETDKGGEAVFFSAGHLSSPRSDTRRASVR